MGARYLIIDKAPIIPNERNILEEMDLVITRATTGRIIESII
jgi:hypothetical protein